MILPTCKEVSTAFAQGEFEAASRLVRTRMWLHLLICRQCRRFRRQMELIEQALRSTVFGSPEPARTEDLARSVLTRLRD